MVKYLAIILCMIILTNCNKKESVAPLKSNDIPDNIFVAGSTNNQITTPYSRATYWNNGNDYYLSDTIQETMAIAIRIKDNDIYIAGHDNLNAILWKNGIGTLLPGGTYAIITGMEIQGDDIYICATGHDTVNHTHIPLYWKNGHLQQLGAKGYANSIAISGNDVYVVGSDTYWKNGVPVRLSDQKHSEQLTAIMVVGNDVYASGIEYLGNNRIAKYWKNGKEYQLSDTVDQIETKGIYVQGNDIYVTGSEQLTNEYPLNQHAVYWKNGIKIKLDGATAGKIIVKNNDVYILGQTQDYKSVLWKNGVPLKLSNQHTVYANDFCFK